MCRYPSHSPSIAMMWLLAVQGKRLEPSARLAEPVGFKEAAARGGQQPGTGYGVAQQSFQA